MRGGHISPSIFMENYRYDSEGNKYVNVGKDLWVLQSDLPSKEEIECDRYRYSNPKIYISDILINIMLPIILLIGMFQILKNIFLIDTKTNIIIICIMLGMYLLLRLRDIAIFVVHLYQKFAPTEVRLRCGYYPTCSDYMILAIKKYGLIIGIIKGLKRIKRCDGTHKDDWP